ncbi:hypothetical protein UFOVP223_85 [uncultured Caudovirales phage]|uniref:Collagen triple helix repeat n=1 Tax=uncultured Caudovirales phage TaxID=2100421 RepID=A0A6J5L7P7_9CAUD|nr:hypothetical protein UFOVP110_79 [uncultured Caudovirales phage]CAB5219507.1 hypothetical protein UFOVP223_85 [uncultured Caudovirales phage]
MSINPNAPVYPEKDISLLPTGDPWIGPSEPQYIDPNFGIPNDQAQPEVDISLLPGVVGQRGPKGDTGATGPAGQNGAPGVSGGYFEYTPPDARAVWNISHNLGYRPNVIVTNSVGTEFIGDIVYTDTNSLTITFTTAVYATAYLS